jgi:hypothetical protein
MSSEVRALIHELYPSFPRHRCGRLYTDTTEFMGIGYGDVIALAGNHYLVLRDEQERRFGTEDPKFWVKRCRVLETGERRILKLVFYEEFPMQIGSFSIRCHRSPLKEARILEVVSGDSRFMQGESELDVQGNNVRILEVVFGRRLDLVVQEVEAEHRLYLHDFLPELLEGFIDACEAIDFLHSKGETHGDIRRDHLWREYDSGRYRWIDFDYAFDFHENPFGLDLFGLGNILVFLVGKGDHNPRHYPEAELTRLDSSIVFGNRVVNLRRLFPYIPERLNNVLLRFSAGTSVFYDRVEELLTDLRPCVRLLRQS